MDPYVRAYLVAIGHTLAATALGDPRARRWALTLTTDRERLVGRPDGTVTITEVLEMLEAGSRSGWAEVMANLVAQ